MSIPVLTFQGTVFVRAFCTMMRACDTKDIDCQKTGLVKLVPDSCWIGQTMFESCGVAKRVRASFLQNSIFIFLFPKTDLSPLIAHQKFGWCQKRSCWSSGIGYELPNAVLPSPDMLLMLLTHVFISKSSDVSFIWFCSLTHHLNRLLSVY